MAISDPIFLRNLIRPCRVFNFYFFKPIKGFSFDSRTIKKGEAFIAIQGKYKDGHSYINEAVTNGAVLVISQKDILDKPRVPFFLVDDTYAAMKCIAAYLCREKNPFVFAITGSVGKTTTKEMLSFLLSGYTTVLKNIKTENNFLGICKTVFTLQQEKALVVELGTNAPGEIKDLAEIVRPDVGIITFVKPVHLEGLKSLRGVFEEKTSLLKANPRMIAVVNGDDLYLKKIDWHKKLFRFGLHKNNDFFARRMRTDWHTSTYCVNDQFQFVLSTPFQGFIYNALAALAGASQYGIQLDSLIRRMNCFKEFPSMRMEVEKIKGLTFLNDAYNANPYSLHEALKTVRKYPFSKIAVIGDMLELGKESISYHQRLASHILKGKFEYVLTMGDLSFYLCQRLKQLKYKNAFHFSSHKDIAHFIATKVKDDSLVFLKGSRRMELEKVKVLLS